MTTARPARSSPSLQNADAQLADGAEIEIRLCGDPVERSVDMTVIDLPQDHDGDVVVCDRRH